MLSRVARINRMSHRRPPTAPTSFPSSPSKLSDRISDLMVYVEQALPVEGIVMGGGGVGNPVPDNELMNVDANQEGDEKEVQFDLHSHLSSTTTDITLPRSVVELTEVEVQDFLKLIVLGNRFREIQEMVVGYAGSNLADACAGNPELNKDVLLREVGSSWSSIRRLVDAYNSPDAFEAKYGDWETSFQRIQSTLRMGTKVFTRDFWKNAFGADTLEARREKNVKILQNRMARASGRHSQTQEHITDLLAPLKDVDTEYYEALLSISAKHRLSYNAGKTLILLRNTLRDEMKVKVQAEREKAYELRNNNSRLIQKLQEVEFQLAEQEKLKDDLNSVLMERDEEIRRLGIQIIDLETKLGVSPKRKKSRNNPGLSDFRKEKLEEFKRAGLATQFLQVLSNVVDGDSAFVGLCEEITAVLNRVQPHSMKEVDTSIFTEIPSSVVSAVNRLYGDKSEHLSPVLNNFFSD